MDFLAGGQVSSLEVITLQRPDPQPVTSTARFAVLLERIIGPIQVALLALAIRRRFMRCPIHSLDLRTFMPLTSDEKNQVRENRFHLDLLDMVLVRRGYPDDVYRGTGFIRQSAEGKMEYRIYDRESQLSFGNTFLSLGVGASIPDDRFYDLDAHDMRGRTWNAARTLPSVASSTDIRGSICSGTAWQITCTEEAPESSSKDGLWMFLPGEFKLATSAGTRVVREALERKSYSFDFNLWQIENDRFEFLLTRVDNGLEVEASPVEESFPEHFDMRLEEALWFVLASPAKWSLLEEVSGGVHRLTIRALRDSSIRPRLRPPLEPGHGEQATHLGEMFTRYLELILPFTENRYHPISVAIYRNLRASALSVDSEALWFPVSIETVIEQCFQHLGCPEQSVLKNLEEAIKYVEKWTGEPAIINRIVKAIKQWRGQNTREALNQLVQMGVISELQLSAWNRVRHRMAHGQQISNLLEELPELVLY